MTVGCIRLEERRWCYEHIAPNGNRAEMLRIRNEPSRGVYIDALFYYIVDFDLDGLIDVGRRPRSRPSAARSARRSRTSPVLPSQHQARRQFQADFQKMYDEGIQIALKYFGE